MNILLDSHTLLWALHAPDRMRPDAVAAIRDPRRAIYFSAASAWELEIKAARGKLVLPRDWLDAARVTGFLQIPVTAIEVQVSARLPWHHADPFDRLLIAQALEHDLHLATRDTLFNAYGVKTIDV